LQQLEYAAGVPHAEARHQRDGQQILPEDRLQVLVDGASAFELHQPNKQRVRRDGDHAEEHD